MAKQPFPVDRGWAWVIVVGSFISYFVMVGMAKSLGMFLTEFQTTFDVPTSVATMVMGSGAIVYAILGPVAIMLGQTFSARQLMIVGTIVGVVGMALSSLLYSIGYVIATFGICFGVGNSTVYGNCLVILGQYFHKRRALANGLALAGASIGQFAMPPLIEFLLETYGLQGSLLLVAGVYCHIALAASLLRPPSYWAQPTETDPQPLQEIEEGEARGNGHLLPSSPTSVPVDTYNSSQLDHGDAEKNDGTENHDASFNTTETTPSSPLVPRTEDARFAHRADSHESGLMLKSYMNSTGSLCLRPLSAYGSSFLFESPVTMEIKEVKEEEEEAGETKEDHGKCFFWRKLAGMFDFSVLKSYVVLLLICSSFVSFTGFFNFVMFLPPAVVSRGISSYDKALVISVCGVGDLVGRLVVAGIGDRNFFPRYRLQAASMFAVGVNITIFIFADSLGWMMVHSVLYGVFGGVYVGLIGVVIIDFVGLKNMPRVLAVVMLFQGVGGAIGQPLLGALRDATGSFQSVLVVCAVSCLTGGLLLLCYPLAVRLERSRPPHLRLLPEEVKPVSIP